MIAFANQAILFYRNKEGVATNAEEIEKLKRMVQELIEKSQEEEKKISDNHVNIENINMNLSLNQRTVMGLVDDHKELID